MHPYLKTLGFSKVKGIDDEHRLIKAVVEDFDDKLIFESPEGRRLAEITRQFGSGFGIKVHGEYGDDNKFYPLYLLPYFIGNTESSKEEVMVETGISGDFCYGACDDLRVGTTLIFYLLNMGEYMVQKIKNEAGKDGEKTIILSGLAACGTILLPVKGSDDPGADKKAEDERNSLLKAAQSGDADAMESLTIEEFDTYSMLIERIEDEDIYTIIDSYFMPQGVCGDRYSIMGTILGCDSEKNCITGEEVVQLTLNCNGIKLDVCINAADLVGEPVAGRRFKGDIWLQGYVYF